MYSTFTTPELIGCWIMNISSVCTNFFFGGGAKIEEDISNDGVSVDLS